MMLLLVAVKFNVMHKIKFMVINFTLFSFWGKIQGNKFAKGIKE